MIWRHYVYLHRKASDGTPFYVGKGAHRRRDKIQTFERASADHSRNRAWRNTVAKHGLVIEIVASCKDDVTAQALERQLISDIGRRQLKRGPLVNLTDGGDGHAGIIASTELRRKRSINASAPRSDEWVSAIRVARKNGGNGGVVKYGDKLRESWKQNIATAKAGSKNPMFGKCGERHHNSKRVVDAQTGEMFPSVTAAAAARGMRMQTLANMLTGFRNNTSGLRFG